MTLLEECPAGRDQRLSKGMSVQDSGTSHTCSVRHKTGRSSKTHRWSSAYETVAIETKRWRKTAVPWFSTREGSIKVKVQCVCQDVQASEICACKCRMWSGFWMLGEEAW